MGSEGFNGAAVTGAGARAEHRSEQALRAGSNRQARQRNRGIMTSPTRTASHPGVEVGLPPQSELVAPPTPIPSDTVATAGRRTQAMRPANLSRLLIDPRRWSQVTLLVDVVILYLAASIALLAAPRVAATNVDRVIALGFPIVVIAMMRSRRSPSQRLHMSLLDTAAHVLGVVSLSGMLAISVDSIFGGPNPLALAPRLWLFAVVYLGVARMILVSLRRQAIRANGTPTVIVGAGAIGSQLAKRLLDEPGYGLRPVGFIDADPLPTLKPSSEPSVKVLGGPGDLARAIATTGARHVILAFSAERDHLMVSKVRECQKLGVEVSLVPRLYESINERATLDHVGGLPLVTLRSIDPRGWQFVVKHALDRTLAALVLLVSAPMMFAIAAVVHASSAGPILFRQRRVGRDGHEFDVLKFRTMRLIGEVAEEFEPPDGCAPGGIEGIDRRTRLGRLLRDLSLDELPQLINVLRGDMSIVGPRPERPEFVARFVRDVARYEDRHRVKSGITGWAQVHGLRGQTSIEDRVEWDNYYIQNWSLRLDLRILALTIAEILRFRG